MYTLYYAPDNASLIIRLVLEELAVPYQTELVNRQIEQHKSEQYRLLAPTGLIPALKTPNGIIFETAAILLWLSDQHGKVAPDINSKDRGEFLSWLFFISNTLHAEMRRLFYPQQYLSGDVNQFHQATNKRIQTHLELLEHQFQRKPSWCTKQQPGAIGCYVVCIWRWLQLYPSASEQLPYPTRIKLKQYPAIYEMVVDFEQRLSAQKAILAEGLGPFAFTHSCYPKHHAGSAT